MLKVYIASSWSNQHAVEMMTALLRYRGCEVLSFVENNYGEGHNHIAENPMPFEEWVKSPESDQSFQYDTNGATKSDLVIYIGPSGKDAAAECGMAWATGIPIIGLHAKREDFGLMRKMMSVWCYRFTDVIREVEKYSKNLAELREANKAGRDLQRLKEWWIRLQSDVVSDDYIDTATKIQQDAFLLHVNYPSVVTKSDLQFFKRKEGNHG